MEKLTSALNIDIVRFMMSDPKINQLLQARDSHPDAAGMELVCKFYRVNPNHITLSAYEVSFIYRTKYLNQDEGYYMAVLVEVKQGTPPSLRILNIKKY